MLALMTKILSKFNLYNPNIEAKQLKNSFETNGDANQVTSYSE